MMEKSFSDRCRDFDENFKFIREEIAKAAVSSGRDPGEIRLLAATKTVPVEVINHAIGQGLDLIGENRVQEFLDKYPSLDTHHCTSHFIGHLQTNKVKYLIGKVAMIQSVDSVKLASEISRLSEKSNVVTDILMEVNIGREEQKGGVMPEQLLDVIYEAAELPGIHICGLMAIPPICQDEKELCSYFSAMQQYYVDIRGKKIDNVNMNCLSMGMSSDFREAIRCGADLVRVGSSLFGKRVYS